uniref:Uncharacterized protein n=1 Tax=Ananas comosus var. bracteatus TaxID=296719 RepID=A0A6V7NNP6_ANACO|nr:unnamed protein product [Ananas comosus var. bracteatus]
MKLAGLRSVENAHDESIWAATWVPATDSRPALLLTGSLDETMRLWHPDELAAAAPPSRGHVLGVVAAAAHPSGSLVAAASLDSSVRVFDVNSNASVASLDTPPFRGLGLAVRSQVFIIFSIRHGSGGGSAGAGVARGFVGLLAEVLQQRGGRRHLPGDRESNRGRRRRLSRRAPCPARRIAEALYVCLACTCSTRRLHNHHHNQEEADQKEKEEE